MIDDILALFARFGSRNYGEGISLERHMLQTATYARALGGSDHVVAAALLHDIGYFLHPGAETSIEDGRNIEHEALGAAWLSRAYVDAVTAPIALHVEAKRYLCAVEPGYYAKLSDASRLTLAVQGGVMIDSEARAFEALPHFDSCVLLRRCDDLGKDVELETQPLSDFLRELKAGLR